MNIIMESMITNLSSNLDEIIENFLMNMGIWGAIFSCLLITVESVLPALPLCVFITIIFYKFGNLVGFLISWIFTCLGCLLSFSLCRYFLKKPINKLIKKSKYKEQVSHLMKKIEHMKLSTLALIVAIPFTPAFAVNIGSAQSDISLKKFMIAMIVGKPFMIYFWGYIGTTLIESLTNPIYLLKIVLMLILAYVISKVIGKIFKIE